MLAHSVDRLPEQPREGRSLGSSWLYEPKYDGYRAIGVVDRSSRVTLYSRRGTDLGAAFPEIVGWLFSELPASSVVDGEIVRWVDGRLDFDAVQHRFQRRRRARELADTAPAHLILFDALEVGAESLMDRRLVERRAALERLFVRIPATSPLALGMQTDSYDTAVAWLAELPAVGIEGVVAKPASSRYRPGQRADWQKVKAWRTTEAIVGGVTGTLQRPRDLVLGRYDATTGELRMAGRTTDLDDQAAVQLAELLRPAGDEHPWPLELPPTWSGRDPSPYIRVQPTAVVEFRADPATSASGWRHRQRFLRLRADLTPADVPLDLDIER